jgi:hypothetical protein
MCIIVRNGCKYSSFFVQIGGKFLDFFAQNGGKLIDFMLKTGAYLMIRPFLFSYFLQELSIPHHSPMIIDLSKMIG